MSASVFHDITARVSGTVGAGGGGAGVGAGGGGGAGGASQAACQRFLCSEGVLGVEIDSGPISPVAEKAPTSRSQLHWPGLALKSTLLVRSTWRLAAFSAPTPSSAPRL